MTKLPSLSYIHPADKAQASIILTEIAKEKKGSDIVLMELCNRTKSKAQPIIDSLGSRFQKQKTLNIQNLDFARDSLYRSIYTMCRGESMRVTHPERVKAANILLDGVFGEKTGLVYYSLLRETSALDEKVNSMKTKFEPQVNTLGLGELVTDISEKNEAFKEAYKNRSSDVENLPAALETMVKPLDRELYTICNYIVSTYEKETIDSMLNPLYKVVKTPSTPEV
jgi:Family of unknown function (DUF6261)